MAENEKWWRKYTKQYQDEDLSGAAGRRKGGAAGLRSGGAAKNKTKTSNLQPRTSNPRKQVLSFSNRNLFDDVGDFTRNIDKVFKSMNFGSDLLSDNFFREPAMPRLMKMEGHTFRKPISEVQETSKEVLVAVELPGVKKNDIQIHIDGRNLIIEAQNREGKEDRRKGFFSFSQSYTGFRHIIPLPTPVEKEASSANFDQGILKIVLKKKKSSEESGDIPIE